MIEDDEQVSITMDEVRRRAKARLVAQRAEAHAAVDRQFDKLEAAQAHELDLLSRQINGEPLQ